MNAPPTGRPRPDRLFGTGATRTGKGLAYAPDIDDRAAEDRTHTG